MQEFRKWICCIDERKFPPQYNFSFGTEEDLARNKLIFQTNFVRTSKYRWYTFLPKSLIIQFERLANIYFLVIAILQSISAISPLGPLTAWAPLIVVLGISMLREGYEDYQRYKSDQSLNHEQKTNVLRGGQLAKVEWSEVVVGDICYVEEEERFPADLILISSSFPTGNAFIETASLDGEKNLKPRNAYPETQHFNNEQKLVDFRGKLKGIVPDKELHEFKSTLEIEGRGRVDFSKDKQLLYRQARLKNTKWIYGLAIYTGRNSKIMMNSQGEANKMSQIQRKVNLILAFILFLQIILCMILGILDGNFVATKTASNSYIAWQNYSAIGDGFLIFCTYLVLLNTMIPISLIVSIQIVKMSQSYFIDNDKFMFSEFRQKGPAVRSASLNEELGQIEYVFTDKTGTLTTNRMEFKIALVGRKYYGDIGLIAPEVPLQKGNGFEDGNLQALLAKGANNEYIPSFFVKNREKTHSHEINNMKELAHQYFTALSIAHQVVVAKDAKGDTKYQGPSPDQITLVDAAKIMGYEFLQSTQSTTKIRVNGVNREFQLLESYSFTSDRKRMSVIVREGGKIKLYTKGADNIIKARLAKEQTFQLDFELDRFARIGLRTLLIAMRYISEEEYAAYRKKLLTLPLENKEQAMEPLISQLQSELYLIGATAVLDRLQDEVPETIRDLIRANIKVWMLTGDKMETAENIAKSCNLIQHNFTVLRYECKDKRPEVIHQQLEILIDKAQKESEDRKVSLLIEGPDLGPIMGVDQLQEDLAELSLYCESVVCCRLLPSQKADVVRVVRDRLGKITLSIGDGANDVPMIKMAHIGVGLFGEQGMGAVLASDYALPQFRMLWRLLLVHGRWNYMRIAQMILYFFYKNMLFTIPQFVFAFYCGYSGQTIFDDIYISLYNLIFTSLPLVIRAVFEQDVNYVRPAKEATEDVSGSAAVVKPYVLQAQYSQYVPPKYELNKYLYRLFPKMYFVGQENCIFNFKNFFLWILEGATEAVLISLFSIYILGTSSISYSGYNGDTWLVSLTIFTSVMMLVTFKLSTHTKFWSWILLISILFFSLGLYFAYMWISNYYFSDYVRGGTYMFFTEGQTYFIVLFCVCFVLFIDGIVLSFDSEYAGVVSKMRALVNSEREVNISSYEKQSIKFSVQTAVINN